MQMNRRSAIRTITAVPFAAPLHAESEPRYRLRAGLVAYSYRKQLAAKSMNYDDLIHKIVDWGLDGLDCTVYWFPDPSNEFRPPDAITTFAATTATCAGAAQSHSNLWTIQASMRFLRVWFGLAVGTVFALAGCGAFSERNGGDDVTRRIQSSAKVL